ncbi:MAG TPA: TadE family protein [Blastocatellia bacterium]|nr:TadE family protein [Blastocatellia bacterium]
MVEIALILPLFLAFAFTIIEIGRVWAVKHALTAAAREGAQVLALPSGAGLTYESDAEAQAAARERVNSFLRGSVAGNGPGTKIDLVRVNFGPDQIYGTADDQVEAYGPAKRGDQVGIRITQEFQTPLPAILSIFKYPESENGITLGVTCYMWHE